MKEMKMESPHILAPAGNRESFLAAVYAGTDAIYCGLKRFSARMEADNFSMKDLARLTGLAHEKKIKVYVTLNALLKPDEITPAGRILNKLERNVKPDGIIVQDLAFVYLAKEVGFRGEIHFSTLSNVTFQSALPVLSSLPGVNRVVLPRELSIDEIKTMAENCPESLGLEVFIHGALCYGVSGRCYWSSFLGGKSGLRGRCVQPCRRKYALKNKSGRFFSCQDLGLDMLVKTLMPIPEIKTWKIEGRKKGPHYVYYTVSAYKLIRDHGNDSQAKKDAMSLLERSLGRKMTHYGFLPQRSFSAVDSSDETASGLEIGTVRHAGSKAYIHPHEVLYARDALRVGYEDDSWHQVFRVTKPVPKNGRYFIQSERGKVPPKGAAVYLLDRREPALSKNIYALQEEADRLFGTRANLPIISPTISIDLPISTQEKIKGRAPSVKNLVVMRKPNASKAQGRMGLWVNPESIPDLDQGGMAKTWWWIPPVIWPENEADAVKALEQILLKGGEKFVLNAPWQVSLFDKIKNGKKYLEKIDVWAGPFCNIANVLALHRIKTMGFTGAIVSPELSGDDYLTLARQTPMPLGIVIYGNWPFCVSRTLMEGFDLNESFVSPKGEEGWVAKNGSDYWIFPNWRLDLTPLKSKLISSGYRFLIELHEPVPERISMKERPALWNWDLKLI